MCGGCGKTTTAPHENQWRYIEEWFGGDWWCLECCLLGDEEERELERQLEEQDEREENPNTIQDEDPTE